MKSLCCVISFICIHNMMNGGSEYILLPNFCLKNKMMKMSVHCSTPNNGRSLFAMSFPHVDTHLNETLIYRSFEYILFPNFLMDICFKSDVSLSSLPLIEISIRLNWTREMEPYLFSGVKRPTGRN